MYNAIIDLSRKDLKYYSIITGIIKSKDQKFYDDFKIKNEVIDFIVLFYEENNVKKSITRLSFKNGNKLAFKKENIEIENFENLNYMKYGYNIIVEEKFESDDKSGYSIYEKIKISKNIDIKYL